MKVVDLKGVHDEPNNMNLRVRICSSNKVLGLEHYGLPVSFPEPEAFSAVARGDSGPNCEQG